MNIKLKRSKKTSENKASIDKTIIRKKTNTTDDGLYFFEDKLTIEGFLSAEVITAAAWLLEIYKLKKGEIYFKNGKKRFCPKSKSFGILYTPFSISRPCFENTEAQLYGFAANTTLSEKFSKTPVIFETDLDKLPQDAKEIIEFLNSGKNFQFIETYPFPSLLSIKTKNLIDENYLIYPSIGQIANYLNVSHEHLSRQFKKDFGLSPSQYLHKLRVSDAAFRLVKGEEIIDVSMEVGYNDLSRFYKQFRKNTKASPGFCQTK